MQYLSPLVVQLQALQQSEYHWLIIPACILVCFVVLRLLWGMASSLLSPFSGTHSFFAGTVALFSLGVTALLVHNPLLLSEIVPKWQTSLGYGLLAITAMFLLIALWRMLRSVLIAGFWGCISLVLIGAVFFDRMPQELLEPGVIQEFGDRGVEQLDLMINASRTTADLDKQIELSLLRYLPDLTVSNSAALK